MLASKDVDNTLDETVALADPTQLQHPEQNCSNNNDNLSCHSQEGIPPTSFPPSENQRSETHSSAIPFEDSVSGVPRSIHNLPPLSSPSSQTDRGDVIPNTVIQIPESSPSKGRGYRVLPLMIGCVIPISIMVNVPSIPSDWVQKVSYNEETQQWEESDVPTPHWISAMSAMALITGTICNSCVLLRFLEKCVWRSIIISLITSTLQDLFCLTAVIPFCILYPTSKGYHYTDGFWCMIASTILSLLSTTLMSIDLYMTPNLQLQDSGLTQKQRVLVALTMLLCFYMSFGSFVMMYIEKWSFLDSLFFGLVTIATIGYGDYAPKTPGGRVFVVFYALGGIVLLAVVVNSIHYVIMEELHGRYLARAKLRERKREERRLKRREERDQEIRRREMGSEEDQLSHNQDSLHQSPLELPTKRCHHDSEDYTHTEAGGEGAHNSDSTFAQKVGSRDDSTEASLGDVAPRSLEAVQERDGPSITLQSLPHSSRHYDHEMAREGGLNRSPKSGSRSCRSINAIKAWWNRVTPFKQTTKQPTKQPTAATYVLSEKEQRIIESQQAYKEDMREYFIRFQISTAMFILFCVVGALLFMWIESWNFGTSMYFIIITFTTIGYGDYTPKTKAGKIVFLVYVLLGVVTLTWLASLTSEILGNKMRNHAVKTQLKKEEKMKARGHLGRDLEEQGSTSEGGLESDAHSLIQSVNGDVESIPGDETYEGSLQQLVRISKEFDQILHEALDVDHPHHKTGPSLPSNSGDIISSLEKEEDESMGLLDPYSVRDIASTNSEEITDNEPKSFPPHSHHRHSKNDTVTVAANQWHRLIEYSKQFMNLTEAAEASLKKLIACETDENRRRRERRQIHARQRRFLRNRRNQLRDYDATPGLTNDEVERELEELEELEDLEDDESLDEKREESMERKRASIVVDLMGNSKLNSRPSSLGVSNVRSSIQPSEDNQNNQNIGVANRAPSNLLREAMKASPNRLHPLSLVMYLGERRRLRNQRNKNNRKRSRTTRTEVLGRSIEEVTIRLEGRDDIEISCSSSYLTSIREDSHEQPADNTQQDDDPGSSSSPRRISM